MSDEQSREPAEAEPARVRRRLESGGAADTKGRSGCLITGAILGIIVGATFAFYGLPPILKHFYGEQHIASGATYEGDGKVIRVETLNPNPSAASPGNGAQQGWIAQLDVIINKTWDAKASDFSIEFAEGGDWLEATAIGLDQADAPNLTATSIMFDVPKLAEPHKLQLVFPAHSGKPKYLHLANPRVRWELP